MAVAAGVATAVSVGLANGVALAVDLAKGPGGFDATDPHAEQTAASSMSAAPSL